MKHTLTLAQLLAPMTIPQLISWAQSLDPNSSWDEVYGAEELILMRLYHH